MKCTEYLNVKVQLTGLDGIMIHPNSGFDLGLMNTSHKVKFLINPHPEKLNDNSDSIETILFLSNNCKQDEIILSNKLWKKIGSPSRLKLFYNDGKVFAYS